MGGYSHSGDGSCECDRCENFRKIAEEKRLAKKKAKEEKRSAQQALWIRFLKWLVEL